ncbi:MAG: TonB-dependent receptor family protein [Chlorobi bacterium]|nr:TonB-dependent receptor family protein [Chlorobiota bacterium]
MPVPSAGSLLRLLSLFVSLLTLTLSAQNTATLRGTVLERGSGKPIGYATVGLYAIGDTSHRPVRGALSLKDGTFLLRNVPPGIYRIRVRLVGYAVATKDSVRVREAGTFDIGSILLDQEAIEQRAVEVSAERELIEVAPDRRVYQVGKDLTVAGGMATDALQNVPGITVDQDRTVQLRGSSNVTVLVDGKPTTLTGGDRSGGTGLDNIPADAIEAIEVITAPGANYDAEGGAGIINIILKREHRQPLSAFGSATVGTRDKYTGFVSVGVRNGIVRANGSYSLSLQNYDFDRHIALTPAVPMDRYPGDVAGARPVRTLTHSPRLDFEADVAGGTLSATLGALLERQRTTATMSYTDYRRFETGSSLQSSPTGRVELRTGTQQDTTTGFDAALGYRRTLTQDWTVSADVRSMVSDSRSGYTGSMSIRQDGITAQSISSWASRIELLSAQADTRYRFGNSGQIEGGVKVTWRRLHSEQVAATDTTDPIARTLTLSTSADVSERVAAAYAQTTLPIGALQLAAGLRAEATDFSVEILDSSGTFTQRYWNLFPTLSVSYSPDQLHRLFLRYSRRISRPQNDALMPIVRLDDPYNQRIGTPNLRPELVHSIELGGTFVLPWATLAPTVYWRSSTDAIGRYRTFDSTTGVTRLAFANWDRVNASGIELLVQAPILSWWRTTLGGSIAYQRIEASSMQAGLSNTGWNATLNWQNVFNFGDGWSGQIGYNLRRIGPIAQGNIGTIRAGEIALRYEFLDGRAAVALRVSDPLDERVFTIAMRTPEFDQDLRMKRESRVAFLTLSYLFGSGQQPKDGTESRPPSDEM